MATIDPGGRAKGQGGGVICFSCQAPMHLVAAITMKAEVVDVYNDDGEITGEDIALESEGYREYWVCKQCGAEWPG